MAGGREGFGAVAISPVSDIVMDVVEAADPRAAEAARAKLASGRSAAAGESFTVDGTAEMPPVPPKGKPAQMPFQRFEAMVLQNFIETMLPKNNEAAFGSGMAGDMWKSMMAEKLAGVMSERGGLGIADRLQRDHYKQGGATAPLGPAAAPPSQSRAGEAMLSTALVEELQRRAVGTLAARSVDNS